MQILILGGTGTISWYVVKIYKEMGHTVLVLNRGNKKNLFQKDVQYIQVNVNDKVALEKVVEQRCFDIVIDFTTYTPNELGNKLDIIAPRCNRYVFISSVAVYDLSKKISFCSENDSIYNPIWTYGYNKSLCESAIKSYYQKYEKGSYTIIRPGITYAESFIPFIFMRTCNGQGYLPHCALIEKTVAVYGDENDLFQIMHAKDFADNLYNLLNTTKSQNDIFNITGDELISSINILKMVSSCMNVPIKIISVGKTNLQKYLGYIANAEGVSGADWSLGDFYKNEKIKSLIKFKSDIRFEEKCSEIIEYFYEKQKYIEWNREDELKIDEMVHQLIVDGSEMKLLNKDMLIEIGIVQQLYRGMYDKIQIIQKLADKERINKEILAKWLENKIETSKGIVEKLKKIGVAEVIIYGYGILGKLLLKELLSYEMNVKAVIDKNLHVDKVEDEVVVKNSITGYENECIIISVISDYDNIYHYLNDKKCQNIVSLEELI